MVVSNDGPEDGGPAIAATVISVPTLHHTPSSLSSFSTWRRYLTGLQQELTQSLEILFATRLTWLLLFGPFAILGDVTGIFGEALCFACSGLALIPCAERLSFVTEQVAEHTNGTIGALLNATFGNAPELLISVAALKAGFYRVVQLAMLGSMLTNMLLVFGASCIIGGLRWQVQELRITSGNVNVTMLLLATAGALFPAVLQLAGQYRHDENDANTNAGHDGEGVGHDAVIFCRVNAFVMLSMYLLYLLFQLGSHKEEFDDDALLQTHPARRNLFCLRFMGHTQTALTTEIKWRNSDRVVSSHHQKSSPPDEKIHFLSTNDDSFTDDDDNNASWSSENGDFQLTPTKQHVKEAQRRRRKQRHDLSNGAPSSPIPSSPLRTKHVVAMRFNNAVHKSKHSDTLMSDHEDDDDDDDEEIGGDNEVGDGLHRHAGPQISLRVGLCWLLIITLCISAMSDILVDTIDGFASRLHLSEVFTSMVVIPFFSNIAEQVSAFLFAYRNEMDLCVGVTVGSAIQIATMVLPGSVLMGAVLGRSMTLDFGAYETVCLIFGVLVTAAILQGGTTNWLTGALLVGIYVMMAGGIWFHEIEDLSVDAELAIRNTTHPLL